MSPSSTAQTGLGPGTALVIVASTSAAESGAADHTGPLLREWLQGRGFDVPPPVIAADGEPVGAALRSALAERPRLILTTGGTGVSPSDRTPEMTEPLLDAQLPGLIEAVRRRGEVSSPLSLLTRGLAGFAGDTLLMNLPGSLGGVRDGIAVLEGVLDHVLAQRTGQVDGAHPASRLR